MIDEYQDSNLVQELILSSISKKSLGGNNLFMVGDVKQSIYRFRQARPELFMEKQENYTLDEFKNSWIAKENTPCIFISAREKIGIDKLRGDLYKMVAEIHAGRYPFDNFLW